MYAGGGEGGGAQKEKEKKKAACYQFYMANKYLLRVLLKCRAF